MSESEQKHLAVGSSRRRPQLTIPRSKSNAICLIPDRRDSHKSVKVTEYLFDVYTKNAVCLPQSAFPSCTSETAICSGLNGPEVLVELCIPVPPKSVALAAEQRQPGRSSVHHSSRTGSAWTYILTVREGRDGFQQGGVREGLHRPSCHSLSAAVNQEAAGPEVEVCPLSV